MYPYPHHTSHPFTLNPSFIVNLRFDLLMVDLLASLQTVKPIPM